MFTGNKKTPLALHFSNTSRERGKTNLQQVSSWWGHYSLPTPPGKPDQWVLPFQGEARAQEHESYWADRVHQASHTEASYCQWPLWSFANQSPALIMTPDIVQLFSVMGVVSLLQSD